MKTLKNESKEKKSINKIELKLSGWMDFVFLLFWGPFV